MKTRWRWRLNSFLLIVLVNLFSLLLTHASAVSRTTPLQGLRSASYVIAPPRSQRSTRKGMSVRIT